MSGPKWDWGMQTAHAARATVVPCVHATCSAATPTRDIQRTLSHTPMARGRSPARLGHNGPNNIPRSTWQADAALHSLQVRETRLSWNESKGVTYARQPNHAVWDMTCFCKSRKDGATGPLCCAGISRSRCCMRRSSGSRCASTASSTTAECAHESRLSWLHAEPQWATALPRPLSCNVRRTLSFGAGLW